ncbi:hypothetical protein LTS18_005348 [Coniosporium uncinatum]|uniref:Uncharacterized protein n=1 Tax=Coniosporium uncinatum TaxID=93489 RepID=A0ACC3D513_9PEZI|nr:hypothetical protein LTS18_005348 [Coniosporium uncinatum]
MGGLKDSKWARYKPDDHDTDGDTEITGTERSSEELAAVPRHIARLERERWAWQAEEERSQATTSGSGLSRGEGLQCADVTSTADGVTPNSSPSTMFTASGPALRVGGRQEEDRAGERATVELGQDHGGYDRLVKEAGREEVGKDEQRAAKEGYLKGIKKKRASNQVRVFISESERMIPL